MLTGSPYDNKSNGSASIFYNPDENQDYSVFSNPNSNLIINSEAENYARSITTGFSVTNLRTQNGSVYADFKVNDYTITKNTTLSKGKWYINNTITVNSGVTLTIPAGTTLVFANGKFLNVNGSLNIQGTSSEKVVLDFQSRNNGIAIYSTASNVNINYAEIKNAEFAIEIASTSSNVTVSNCEIYNSSMGVYLYNSNATISNTNIHNLVNAGMGVFIFQGSPKIQNSTIHDIGGTNYGIFASNGTTAKIFGNTIYNTAYGIYVSNANPIIEANIIYSNSNSGILVQSYSNPMLGDENEYEYETGNSIYTNAYGIYVKNGCYVDAGHWATLSGCYNSIYSNTSYNTYVTDNSILYAQYNWWGNYPPITSKFFTGSGCEFYYQPYLASAPTPQLVLGPPLVQQALSTSSSSSSLLTEAYAYKLRKNYAKAIENFKMILSSADKQNKIHALIGLYNVAVNNPSEDIINYIESYSSDKYEKSELYPVALDILSNFYAMQNNELKTEKYSNILINNFKSTEHEKLGLVNKITLYVNQKKYDKAKNIYNQLASNFSDDPDCIMASIVLSKVDSSIQPIAAKSSINKTAYNQEATEEAAEIPSEYSISQNFPNPFNPATTIRFALPAESRVTLEVFNILGERVAELVNDVRPAGTMDVRFDGSNLASGIYIYKFNATSLENGKHFQKINKMMLLK